MAGFYGADVTELRALSKQFTRAANVLNMQNMSLGGTINSTTSWQGKDAETFRQDWNRSHRQTIIKAVTLLNDGARALSQNADQQEYASQRTGTNAASDIKDVIVTVLKNSKKLLWDKPKDLYGSIRNSDDFLRNAPILKLIDKADEAGNVRKALSFTDEFAQLSKFKQATKLLGVLGGPLSVAGGIHDMLSPEHDGWRATGDRVAGGLSVVSGVGGMMLMTAGGAALLGPVGAPIVIGAGIVAGAWALGNLVADHWDTIKNFAEHPVQYISDGVKDLGNAAKDTFNSAVDAGKDALEGAKNFIKNPIDSLGGIFG